MKQTKNGKKELKDKMRIITERDLIRDVAKQWREQYQRYMPSYQILAGLAGKTVGEIQAKLDALDVETATPEDVKAIVGNYRKTILECHECGNRCKQVVSFDVDDDSTCELCFDCLIDALMLINGFTPSCSEEE
jgi:hypothetical protein